MEKMTSTDLSIGLKGEFRPTSRVLKPPGGGHTNIFSEPEVAVNAPRPKYNQQNSSNLNACMGSTDPNAKVEQLRAEIVQQKPVEEDVKVNKSNGSQKSDQQNAANNNNSRPNRVPPGGYSSGGFW